MIVLVSCRDVFDEMYELCTPCILCISGVFCKRLLSPLADSVVNKVLSNYALFTGFASSLVSFRVTFRSILPIVII